MWLAGVDSPRAHGHYSDTLGGTDYSDLPNFRSWFVGTNAIQPAVKVESSRADRTDGRADGRSGNGKINQCSKSDRTYGCVLLGPMGKAERSNCVRSMIRTTIDDVWGSGEVHP